MKHGTKIGRELKKIFILCLRLGSSHPALRFVDVRPMIMVLSDLSLEHVLFNNTPCVSLPTLPITLEN